jgi:DNA processing protein
LDAAFDGLWCTGDPACLAQPTVAIVGTRAATAYGRRLSRAFAASLGRAGCTIVSGLALGIDAAAHEGALDEGARTVGILGGGHACFFPPRNAALADRMLAAGGAVLSPFDPEHPAYPHQFLERNGVVAALADALVVIEAPQRSGALNTASWAAGRIPVLAVPGDVDRPHVQGCLALIRDGATLARNPGDVLEAIGLSMQSSDPRPAPQIADPLAREILRRLAGGECDLDTLVRETAADAARVLGVLALLELDGHVESRGGTRYATLHV